MKSVVVVIMCWLIVWSNAACASEDVTSGVLGVARDGDVILHRSQSSQAQALRHATGSPYTHVGLIFEHAGQMQVLEAVEPVRWTPLEEWIERGQDEHVILLRAGSVEQPLSGEAIEGVRTAAESYLGRSYDLLFEWSDDRIYCSELVYKAFQAATGLEIGEPARMDSFDLDAVSVQELIAARTRGSLDPGETVVSPASIIDDEDVYLVYTSDPEAAAQR